MDYSIQNYCMVPIYNKWDYSKLVGEMVRIYKKIS